MVLGGGSGIQRSRTSAAAASAAESSDMAVDYDTYFKSDALSAGAYHDAWKTRASVSESDVNRDLLDFTRRLRSKASASTAAGGASTTKRYGLDDVGGFVPEDYIGFAMTDAAKNKILQVMARDHVTQKDLEQERVEDRLRYQFEALADGYPKITQNMINDTVQRMMTRAAELREQSAYYGIPESRKEINRYDFTGNRTQPNLLEAFEGENRVMTSWYILQLIVGASWYTRYALPLVRDDNINLQEAEIVIFNPTLLDRTPILSTASYTTSRTMRYKTMPVRYGKSLEMEFTFWRTKRGRFFWQMQQVQIMNATASTIDLGVIVALMKCKTTTMSKFLTQGRDRGVSGGQIQSLYATREAFEKDLVAEQRMWDRICKGPGALNSIVDRACDAIRDQVGYGMSGGELIKREKGRIVAALPENVPRLVQEIASSNAPSVTGVPRNFDGIFEPEDDQTQLMAGGWRLARSRAFRTHNGEMLDPQKSTQTIGHFAYARGGTDWAPDAFAGAFRVGPGFVPNSASALAGQQAANEQAKAAGLVPPSAAEIGGALNYRTAMNDIETWQASSDTLKRRMFAEIVANNQMYETPHGVLGNGRPRKITKLGLAAVLRGDETNPTRYMRQTVDLNGTVMEPDYYPTVKYRGSPSEFRSKSRARMTAAGRHIDSTQDFTKYCMSAYEFWGPENCAKIAPWITARRGNATFTDRLSHVRLSDNTTVGGMARETVSDVIAMMKRITMHDSGFLDLLLEFDIPVLMEHIIFTPFSQYRACCCVTFRAGSTQLASIDGAVNGIGETQYALPSYLIAFEAKTGHYDANFHVWLRSKVHLPQYVFIDKAVFIERHERGDNGEFFTTQDQNRMNSNSSMASDEQAGNNAYYVIQNWWKTDRSMAKKSDFSIFLPPNALPLSGDHMDITGAYANSAVSEEMDMHYPTAEFYKQHWHFHAVNTVNQQDVEFSAREGNSVVSRKYHMAQDPFRTNVQVRRKDKGYWGERLSPGYMSARVDLIDVPTLNTASPFIRDE